MSHVRIPEGCGARLENGQARLYALRAFAAGEPILLLEHVRWRAQPDPTTVPHPNGHAFFDPLLPMIVLSGDPNGRLSIQLMALIARRDISIGEGLSRGELALGDGLRHVTKPCLDNPMGRAHR
ncbi:MAG: hypothetical protein P4L64_01095 [Caulobacteraceae bacterium]|nr:hypothetical protein [Caulobacteraceae bacterium]